MALTLADSAQASGSGAYLANVRHLRWGEYPVHPGAVVTHELVVLALVGRVAGLGGAHGPVVSVSKGVAQGHAGTAVLRVLHHRAERVRVGLVPFLDHAVKHELVIDHVLAGLLLGDAAGIGPLTLIVPDAREWHLLLAIGLLGTTAHLLMTWSLRYAPSATLAPMQYLEIPVATLIGWAIFSDLPDGLAAVGIMITVAAGLYVILRERATARSAPTETPA